MRVEKERSRATGKNIFDGARHLFPHRPYYFGADVGEVAMQLLSKRGRIVRKGANLFRVRAIHGKRAQAFLVFKIAMDMQVARYTVFVRKFSERDGMVDRVLGHVAIGGPLAADNRQQARCIDVHRVIAREG
jgi:hypothetical protein